MMNSDSTHKVVVGIVLAVLLGVGLSVFAVRAKHESEVARVAPAPAELAPVDQNATDEAASAQSAAAQTPTDETAAPSSEPATNPSASNVANDATGAPAGDESKPAKSKATDRADHRVAKTRSSGDLPDTRVASAANSNTGAAYERASNNEPTSAPSSSDTMSSAPAGASADTQQDSAQTRQEAATSTSPAATSVEPVASDSQITAYVKSEIATAAPNSNVDVKTTDGFVALSGSVSSQEAVDQARRAAQRVPGVKQVDASGLMIVNQ
jgi:osmotically-inducible protein OsmY